MSKQKQVGTAFESGVVNYVHWFSGASASRPALTGTGDLGDVHIDLGEAGVIVVQCKAGRAAEMASPRLVDRWLVEVYGQALRVRESRSVASSVVAAALVVKRPGLAGRLGTNATDGEAARFGGHWVYPLLSSPVDWRGDKAPADLRLTLQKYLEEVAAPSRGIKVFSEV